MPTVPLISRMGCVLVWIIGELLSCNFAWQIKGKMGFKLKEEAKTNIELRGRKSCFKGLYARWSDAMQYKWGRPFKTGKGTLRQLWRFLLSTLHSLTGNYTSDRTLPLVSLLVQFCLWERGILLVLWSAIMVFFLRWLSSASIEEHLASC